MNGGRSIEKLLWRCSFAAGDVIFYMLGVAGLCGSHGGLLRLLFLGQLKTAARVVSTLKSSCQNLRLVDYDSGYAPALPVDMSPT